MSDARKISLVGSQSKSTLVVPVKAPDWVGIKLLDEVGIALVGERYWIRFPDDTEQEGTLDEEGSARLLCSTPGQCIVRFPDLDQAEWEPPTYDNTTAWVGIELVDSEGMPLAGETVELVSADGDVVVYVLDENGRVKMEGLDPGGCFVRFPDVDAQEWEPPTYEVERTAWIGLALVDELGEPMVDEPYRLVASDGEVREGTLDSDGEALIEDLASGPCYVTFPGFDRGEWVPPVVEPTTFEGEDWLGIEVMDETGTPQAGLAFEVELPDGTLKCGTLDENGEARLDELPGGRCLVRFPEIDKLDWEPPNPVEIASPVNTYWIGLELVDQEGQPYAGEPYEVEAPTGRVWKGALDANGEAVVEGLPSSRCIVRFPERDVDDWGPEAQVASRAGAVRMFGLAKAAERWSSARVKPVPGVSAAMGWVGLELADAAGNPVAGAAYELIDAEGQVFTGQLDADGEATVEGISLGPCKVVFPEFDRGAFLAEASGAENGMSSAVGASGDGAATAEAWVGIELIDAHGAPVAGAPFHLRGADGRVHEGVLSSDGEAVVEGLADGPCQVVFPTLDVRDVVLDARA